MELTKRQIRALVLAGNLKETDFPGAFPRKPVNYLVGGLPGGRIAIHTTSGIFLADAEIDARDGNPTITMRVDPLDFEVVCVGGSAFIRVWRFED